MKISIRFFNDQEVRAIWDDEHSHWRFSVLDIVGVLNEEPNYTKTRNYWKYLKAKLKKQNSQLVSTTTQLKLTAADGKKCVDWSKIRKEDYMNAMIISTVDSSILKQLIETALTTKIHDREMFMKGIDYSYYYEE
ncbi:hypothetical protein [Aquiflexum sp.]|uniref:hypothetical protein n=1 Tax=Aquiflexum sp. TaxID=1872584 RepID=UPI00359468BF